MYYENNKLVRKEISDKNNIICACDWGKRVKFESLNYGKKTEYHQLYKTQQLFFFHFHLDIMIIGTFRFATLTTFTITKQIFKNLKQINKKLKNYIF